MRGAYVATPLPEVVPDVIPYGWNPDWPFGDDPAEPPGYSSPSEEDLDLTFVEPPTPDEVRIDEEITIQVWLRDAIHELPTSRPGSGTPDILWYAVLGGVIIWAQTSSWTKPWGYYGGEITFTPPLIEEDVGGILTFHAEWAPVFDGIAYPVNATYDTTVTSKVPVAFEGYAIWNNCELTGGATNPRLNIKTYKSGTSNRDWSSIWLHGTTDPEYEGWTYTTPYSQLPEVISISQSDGSGRCGRIDISIPSLLTDGMYSIGFTTEYSSNQISDFSLYAKVTYDDDSFDIWTKNFTFEHSDETTGAAIIIERGYGGYVEPSSDWD